MSRIQMMGALALSLGWRLRESAEKGLPEYHKPFHITIPARFLGQTPHTGLDYGRSRTDVMSVTALLHMTWISRSQQWTVTP